jgi:hypothetical protein
MAFFLDWFSCNVSRCVFFFSFVLPILHFTEMMQQGGQLIQAVDQYGNPITLMRTVDPNTGQIIDTPVVVQQQQVVQPQQVVVVMNNVSSFLFPSSV